MLRTSLVLVALALAFVSTNARANPFAYVCHDNGDGTYTQEFFATEAEYVAHRSHAGDIIPEAYFPTTDGNETGYPPINYDEPNESIWADQCALEVQATPPPVPDIDSTPEPDVDDPEVVEVVATATPEAAQDAAPTPITNVDEVETVTQFPNTGSGPRRYAPLWWSGRQ